MPGLEPGTSWRRPHKYHWAIPVQSATIAAIITMQLLVCSYVNPTQGSDMNQLELLIAFNSVNNHLVYISNIHSADCERRTICVLMTRRWELCVMPYVTNTTKKIRTNEARMCVHFVCDEFVRLAPGNQSRLGAGTVRTFTFGRSITVDSRQTNKKKFLHSPMPNKHTHSRATWQT